MAKVKKWLNNLWLFDNSEYKVFDPNKELSYADRVRRREPGDDTLGPVSYTHLTLPTTLVV